VLISCLLPHSPFALILSKGAREPGFNSPDGVF